VNLSAHGDLSVRSGDLDVLRLEGRIALQSILDPLMDIGDLELGPDADLVVNTPDARKAADILLGSPLLELPVHLSGEGGPAILHRDLNPVVRSWMFQPRMSAARLAKTSSAAIVPDRPCALIDYDQ
jgi:hypothetical protein